MHVFSFLAFAFSLSVSRSVRLSISLAPSFSMSTYLATYLFIFYSLSASSPNSFLFSFPFSLSICLCVLSIYLSIHQFIIFFLSHSSPSSSPSFPFLSFTLSVWLVLSLSIYLDISIYFFLYSPNSSFSASLLLFSLLSRSLSPSVPRSPLSSSARPSPSLHTHSLSSEWASFRASGEQRGKRSFAGRLMPWFASEERRCVWFYLTQSGHLSPRQNDGMDLNWRRTFTGGLNLLRALSEGQQVHRL